MRKQGKKPLSHTIQNVNNSWIFNENYYFKNNKKNNHSKLKDGIKPRA